MKHELKIYPEYFNAIKTGEKRFEARKNDRGYKVGDLLRLREYHWGHCEHTGNEVTVIVTYILEGNKFGVIDGYCIMSILRLDKISD